uniref:Uncharacterized protein n=1 Tax=Triticum urartu TaxID=4572 RepID=A0A8R7R5C1_TRIUA
MAPKMLTVGQRFWLLHDMNCKYSYDLPFLCQKRKVCIPCTTNLLSVIISKVFAFLMHTNS